MPVRYDIAAMVPQVSGGATIDPVNFMAQIRQQEMADAQMQQMALRGYYQDLAAQRAAETSRLAGIREERQAKESEVNTQAAQEKLLADKLHRTFSAIAPGDQKAFLAASQRFAKYDPEFATWLGQQEYTEDLRNRLTLTAEKQAELKQPKYSEFGGEVYQTNLPGGIRPAPIVPFGAEGMPGPRQSAAGPLVEKFEGFRATPYFDVNADRVGFGSSTVTREDGTVEKVRKGMAPITKEDARRDLDRRLETEFVPKAAAKVGEENWARLPENTRAALTSIAYNYGTIPSRLVPAVQSGNTEEIAKAIEGLAGDNKGVNAGRRMQEANIARGTTMPGSAAVPAFAAAGAPTFMGGPQIQPPINMMAAPPMPPANAMTAPALPPPTAPQPAQPITVGTKKQIKGQSNIDKTLDKMLGTYEDLLASGNLISSEKATSDPLGTIGTYFSGTTLGQEVERARGSKAQDKRNRILALRGQLLQDIKEATGQTSKELDSNFELKTALERLGDPTMSIESIRAIVSDMSARYGSGKIKTPEETPAAAAPAQRSIVKRGTYNGRPVVQYSDGTIDYAN